MGDWRGLVVVRSKRRVELYHLHDVDEETQRHLCHQIKYLDESKTIITLRVALAPSHFHILASVPYLSGA